MDRRVVITGLGVISPLGNSPQELWGSILAGKSGVQHLENPLAGILPSPFGARSDFSGDIDDFGPLEKGIQRSIKKALKLMCREIQMGVAASQKALVHGGITPGKLEPDRAGVVFGCDYILTMPEDFQDGVRECVNGDNVFQFERWADFGRPKVEPLWLLKYLPNMPASHVAIYNDFRGPNNSLTMREASSNVAIGEATSTIARGHADLVLAGATGTRLHPMKVVHAHLEEEVARGEEPDKLSRPFDLHRTGMVLGEGAAVLVLEELNSARDRGATIYGEVIASASSSVSSVSEPPAVNIAIDNVLVQLVRRRPDALKRLGHIHSHGLGAVRIDKLESRAIRNRLNDWGLDRPVVSAKSYFGNLGASSGMVELITSLLAIREKRLFPNLNLETPDPDCPVRVPKEWTETTGSIVINLSITPQGQASGVMVDAHVDT